MKQTAIDSMPREARLQFECVKTGTENYQVDYELVLPLDKVDCRGTFNHKARKTRPKSHRHIWLDSDNCMRIPLGRTKVGSSNPIYPFSPQCGTIDLPFRDGAHAGWDNQKLNLKLYYLVSGKTYLLEKEKSQ